MINTLIIGKNSNLSNNLYYMNNNFILLSSREILNNIEILKKYKNEIVNIIFNNFQTSTKLNNLNNCYEYITSAIGVTSMVLDYFQNTKINKIIYTSSSSVYGNNILCKESDELKPMNLHASLKVANEKMIQKYCQERDIDYTIARIFNMYGGDDNFSIVSKIIDAYLKHKELTIVNNGNAIRDFIHIDDVVRIYIKLLNIENIKVLNIGTGFGNSIKNILDYLLNHSIIIDTKNIYKDELKISTSDNKFLFETVQKSDSIKVQDYLKDKLNL